MSAIDRLQQLTQIVTAPGFVKLTAQIEEKEQQIQKLKTELDGLKTERAANIPEPFRSFILSGEEPTVKTRKKREANGMAASALEPSAGGGAESAEGADRPTTVTTTAESGAVETVHAAVAVAHPETEGTAAATEPHDGKKRPKK